MVRHTSANTTIDDGRRSPVSADGAAKEGELAKIVRCIIPIHASLALRCRLLTSSSQYRLAASCSILASMRRPAKQLLRQLSYTKHVKFALDESLPLNVYSIS